MIINIHPRILCCVDTSLVIVFSIEIFSDRCQILSRLRSIKSSKLAVRLLCQHQLDDRVIVVDSDVLPSIVHHMIMYPHLRINQLPQFRRILQILNMIGNGISGGGELFVRTLTRFRNIRIHLTQDIFRSSRVGEFPVKIIQFSEHFNGLLYGRMDYRLRECIRKFRKESV